MMKGSNIRSIIKPMILVHIQIFVSKHGFRRSIIRYEAKEAKTISFRPHGFQKRLPLDQLMKIKTPLHRSYERVDGSIYCREKDIEAAKEMLEAYIQDEFDIIRRGFEGLQSHMNDQTEWEESGALEDIDLPAPGELKL